MNCEDGTVNSGKLWKLKKKLHSNFPDLPTAIRDSKGKLLTAKEDFLEETVEQYEQVLKKRPIKEGLEHHQNEREHPAYLRLEQASLNKTPDWDITDLTEALKSLKIASPVMPLGTSMSCLSPQLLEVI